MYNFFSLMVVSFCIKEPLDFTRVHQIELKISKFPGGGPHTPQWEGATLSHTYPPVGSADGRRCFAPSLAGSISKLTGRQIS